MIPSGAKEMFKKNKKKRPPELYDLNPIRYKKEKKPYNRIVVRDYSKKKKKKVNWALFTAMIITGIAFIMYPGFLKWTGEQDSQKLMENFVEKMEEEDEEEMDVEEEEDETKTSLSQEDADTLSREEVIGIIEISSIDIKYPVLEGTGNDVLNIGIGHITETEKIGGKGNCVLCGHNGSRRGTFFTPLNAVQLGDKVELLDKKGVLHEYEIVNTKIVEPRDNSIKDTDGTEKLTLFTCAEHGTRRFVCECLPIVKNKNENTNYNSQNEKE